MEGENCIRKRDASFAGMRNFCLTDSEAGLCVCAVDASDGKWKQAAATCWTRCPIYDGKKNKTHYSENGTADCRSRVLYATIRIVRKFFFFCLCVRAAKHWIALNSAFFIYVLLLSPPSFTLSDCVAFSIKICLQLIRTRNEIFVSEPACVFAFDTSCPVENETHFFSLHGIYSQSR